VPPPASRVAPDLHTYTITIGSFCSIGRLDFGFAAFGLILKKGFRVDAVAFNQLLNGLCDAKRVGEGVRPWTYCSGECLSLAARLSG
jgi:leucine-rich PPR motif-containing protein